MRSLLCFASGSALALLTACWAPQPLAVEAVEDPGPLFDGVPMLPSPPPLPPTEGDGIVNPDEEEDSGQPSKAETDDPDDQLLKQMREANKPVEQVQAQKQVVEAQVEQAEELSEELAGIVQRLRAKKGLPKEVPYVSPLEQAHEDRREQEELEQHQVLGLGPPEEPVGPVQVQDPNQDQELPPPEEADEGPKEAPPDQDQEQQER